jgi:SAM-dependent methyltransferase
MTDRALELLNLPDAFPSYILDIGCGSGLSGEVLSESGHVWVGCDIAPSMLQIALTREVISSLHFSIESDEFHRSKGICSSQILVRDYIFDLPLSMQPFRSLSYNGFVMLIRRGIIQKGACSSFLNRCIAA